MPAPPRVLLLGLGRLGVSPLQRALALFYFHHQNTNNKNIPTPEIELIRTRVIQKQVLWAGVSAQTPAHSTPHGRISSKANLLFEPKKRYFSCKTKVKIAYLVQPNTPFPAFLVWSSYLVRSKFLKGHSETARALPELSYAAIFSIAMCFHGRTLYMYYSPFAAACLPPDFC